MLNIYQMMQFKKNFTEISLIKTYRLVCDD